MIDIGTWADKANTRVEMAISETVKQLEYEANALWKGKRVCGETVLDPILPVDGLVSRVAVIYHPADYAWDAYMEVVIYTTVEAKEIRVNNPHFSVEQTP
jgi:hypothetical protein